MKELVVISGKGGTGKTSITASLAMLAHRPVVADCDVDASDLHLILAPEIQQQQEFYGSHVAVIHPESCQGCGICQELCRFGAIKEEGSAQAPKYFVDSLDCEGCGLCVQFCPQKAIGFPERLCGQWMISKTRCGPMVHARLNAGAENSGKLVSTVRREARRLAEQEERPLILVDGPPGIGCPVIASITGASLILVVAEPTVSGEHDLERVLALANHFKIPAMLCVNKWDINKAMAERIENKGKQAGALVAGRISYNRAMTQAQLQGRSLVEYAGEAGGAEVISLWRSIRDFLDC